MKYCWAKSFQSECCPFLFLWFSVFHNVTYPSKDIPLTLWQLCVTKSFSWSSLKDDFLFILPDWISHLLCSHDEPSFNICQSWYSFTKALLSLPQYIQFNCIVINSVFWNCSPTFSGIIVRLTALYLPRSSQETFSKPCVPLVVLLFWYEGSLIWEAAVFRVCVFSRLLLKYFLAWLLVF